MDQFALPESAKIEASALPKTAAERVDWLRLSRSWRVGPATFIRLLREHGSVAAALKALPDIARGAGVAGYNVCSAQSVEREIAAGTAAGARLLCLGEAEYPAMLATIPDPPPVLWAIGDLRLLNRPAVAVVGARNASSLGQRMAERLARELAEAGITVVSGLARGIDAAAHAAALELGTIAVTAGGVDIVYPPENAALTKAIAAKGLILSEMPMGLSPQARHFPRRNRIISGLSQAVIVVEGAMRSGSLITARDALDQGREVMAVPGHPFDARASGCNMLIRDGATLVRSAADVIVALALPERSVKPAPQPAPVAAPTVPQDRITTDLLNLLGPAPVSEDILIRQLRLPTPLVLEALMDLDLSGKIERHPGGLVSRLVA